MKGRTGLFFGSFNPVHIGHMVIANYMLEYAGLDRLWFVVSPHNPHKQKSTLADQRKRWEMVNLAIGDNPRMRASDIEFNLPQPSYTINTLVHLEEKYPENKFVLIMGQDNLASLPRWKNYEQILERFEILVYPRPGLAENELLSHPNVRIVSSPLMEISSTMLREGIRQGKDLRYMVPSAVWEYLSEMHLYSK
jgi:nicotinate-nucleotide adenylyltransferase